MREKESEWEIAAVNMPLFLSPVLSTSLYLCFPSHGAEQRGVRKASLFLFHLSAFAHHSRDGNVKQTVIVPVYVTLSTLSPVKLTARCMHSPAFCLTPELHMLEFNVFDMRSYSVGFRGCGLCAPLSLTGSKVSSLKDSWERPTNTDTMQRPWGSHHLNMSHTFLASLCIRDVECCVVSNVTTASRHSTMMGSSVSVMHRGAKAQSHYHSHVRCYMHWSLGKCTV